MNRKPPQTCCCPQQQVSGGGFHICLALQPLLENQNRLHIMMPFGPCPTPPESRSSSLHPLSTRAGMARRATLGSSVWEAILICFRKTMHITGSSLGPALQNGGKSNSNYVKEVKWRLSTVFIVSAGAVTTIFLRRNILLTLTRLRPQKNRCFRSFGEASRVKLECDIKDGILSKACRPCYDKNT